MPRFRSRSTRIKYNARELVSACQSDRYFARELMVGIFLLQLGLQIEDLGPEAHKTELQPYLPKSPKKGKHAHPNIEDEQSTLKLCLHSARQLESIACFSMVAHGLERVCPEYVLLETLANLCQKNISKDYQNFFSEKAKHLFLGTEHKWLEGVRQHRDKKSDFHSIPEVRECILLLQLLDVAGDWYVEYVSHSSRESIFEKQIEDLVHASLSALEKMRSLTMAKENDLVEPRCLVQVPISIKVVTSLSLEPLKERDFKSFERYAPSDAKALKERLASRVVIMDGYDDEIQMHLENLCLEGLSVTNPFITLQDGRRVLNIERLNNVKDTKDNYYHLLALMDEARFQQTHLSEDYPEVMLCDKFSRFDLKRFQVDVFEDAVRSGKPFIFERSLRSLLKNDDFKLKGQKFLLFAAQHLRIEWMLQNERLPEKHQELLFSNPTLFAIALRAGRQIDIEEKYCRAARISFEQAKEYSVEQPREFQNILMGVIYVALAPLLYTKPFEINAGSERERLLEVMKGYFSENPLNGEPVLLHLLEMDRYALAHDYIFTATQDIPSVLQGLPVLPLDLPDIDDLREIFDRAIARNKALNASNVPFIRLWRTWQDRTQAPDSINIQTRLFNSLSRELPSDNDETKPLPYTIIPDKSSSGLTPAVHIRQRIGMMALKQDNNRLLAARLAWQFGHLDMLDDMLLRAFATADFNALLVILHPESPFGVGKPLLPLITLMNTKKHEVRFVKMMDVVDSMLSAAVFEKELSSYYNHTPKIFQMYLEIFNSIKLNVKSAHTLACLYRHFFRKVFDSRVPELPHFCQEAVIQILNFQLSNHLQVRYALLLGEQYLSTLNGISDYYEDERVRLLTNFKLHDKAIAVLTELCSSGSDEAAEFVRVWMSLLSPHEAAQLNERVFSSKGSSIREPERKCWLPLKLCVFSAHAKESAQRPLQLEEDTLEIQVSEVGKYGRLARV